MEREAQVMLEYPQFVGRLYRRVMAPQSTRIDLTYQIERYAANLRAAETPADKRLWAGNILFCLQALSISEGWTLVDLIVENRKRLTERYPTGYVPGNKQVDIEKEPRR